MFDIDNIDSSDNSKKDHLPIMVDLPSEDELSDLYPVVHPNDRELVHLFGLNFEKGPWIAGGAVLQWYLGQPVDKHDIDVFYQTTEQADEAVERMLNLNTWAYSKKYLQQLCKTENATTFTYHQTIFQFIRMPNPSIESLLLSFDITVCQIATDGKQFYFVDKERTVSDIENRRISIVKQRPNNLKRLIKYWVYGYTPTNDSINKIKTNKSLDIDYSYNGFDYDFC